jgi:hypothetical protein
MTPLTEALRRADHETGYEPEELIPFHHYAELVVRHLREIELETTKVQRVRGLPEPDGYVAPSLDEPD